MELETIVKNQNTDPKVLCDYAEKVCFLSNNLYWCTYTKKCVYQTNLFFKKYCDKELNRDENVRTETKRE